MDDAVSRRTVVRNFGAVPLFALPDYFEPSPTVRWQFEATGELLLTAGSFHDAGRLFVGRDTSVFCLGLTDGEKRWAFSPTLGEGDCRPVAVDGTVFITRRGVAYALTLDGQKRWEVGFGSTSRPSLAYEDGLAFLGSDGVYAIDAVSGERKWAAESDSFDDVRALSIYFDSLYVVTRDTAYSLSPKTGTIRWQAPVDAIVGPARVGIADGTVFVSDGRKMVGLRATNGERRWEIESDELTVSSIGEETAYVWDSQHLRAIDAREGTTEWTFDPEELPVSPLSKVGRTVICATDAAVYSLDEATGNINWRYSRTRGDGPFLPTVGDDAVYIFNEQGVVALDRLDGTSRWQFVPERGSPVTVHSVEDAVFIVTDEGSLYAVGPPFRGPAESLLREPLSVAMDRLPIMGLFGGATALLAVETYRRRSSDPDSATRDFDIVARLGRDGVADVYRARLPDGRNAVVKQLTDESRSERFQTVIDRTVALDHEGLPEVLDYGDDPTKWLGIPYYGEASLASRYEAISLSEGLRLVARACEIVHSAHQSGTVHGRLGPERVRFAGKPTAENVRVEGWVSNLTREADGVPEASERAISKDVLQLGGVACWFVRAKNGDEITPDNSRLRTVLTTATATESEQRYRSALELADMLRWAVRE